MGNWGTQQTFEGMKDRIQHLLSPVGTDLIIQFDGQDSPINVLQQTMTLDEFKNQLPRIIKTKGITSLTIQYQGPELWVVLKPKQEKKLQYFLARQLPPGKGLGDYQISFHALKDHDLIGLLPKTSCTPFFELAEQYGLLECHIIAIPQEMMQETGAYLCSYDRVSWYVERRKSLVKRLLPICESDRPFLDMKPYQIVESGSKEPLFKWNDPKQKERQKAYRDREFLKLAVGLTTLILGFIWVALLISGAVMERRLNQLTVSRSKLEVHQKKYMSTYREYEALISELDGIVTTQGDRIPVAVTFRKMMLLCPQSFIFTNMLFQHEDLAFTVSGYAPNQTEMTSYLKLLKESYATSDIELIQFQLRSEPINDKLLQSKGVSPGMYFFMISFRWQA